MNPDTLALLRLLRFLFEAVQSANELKSELPERALLAFEGIAPQGFDPLKAGSLLSSLGKDLAKLRGHVKGATGALCEVLETVALGWSKGFTLERVALEELRHEAIITLAYLGEPRATANKKIRSILEK